MPNPRLTTVMTRATPHPPPAPSPSSWFILVHWRLTWINLRSVQFIQSEIRVEAHFWPDRWHSSSKKTCGSWNTTDRGTIAPKIDQRGQGPLSFGSLLLTFDVMSWYFLIIGSTWHPLFCFNKKAWNRCFGWENFKILMKKLLFVIHHLNLKRWSRLTQEATYSNSHYETLLKFWHSSKM